MKKNIGLIILIVLLVGITAFLSYIIVSKQNQATQTFNLQEGDVVNFDEYGIKATILNVASTLCDNKDTCISEGEIEVSVKIDYEGNVSSYTLKTVKNPSSRIEKSNYYISLKYEEEKLILEVTEK